MSKPGKPLPGLGKTGKLLPEIVKPGKLLPGSSQSATQDCQSLCRQQVTSIQSKPALGNVIINEQVLRHHYKQVLLQGFCKPALGKRVLMNVRLSLQCALWFPSSAADQSQEWGHVRARNSHAQPYQATSFGHQHSMTINHFTFQGLEWKAQWSMTKEYRCLSASLTQVR